MIHINLKNKGISLIEVMIAGAILGVISLGVMKIMDMQTTSSHKMDIQLSEGELFRRITTNLADSEACLKTLKSSLSETPMIVKKSGNPLYKIGDRIGHLEIQNISFSNNTGDGNKTVTITLTIKRLGKVMGAAVIHKNFSLDAKFKNNTPITCYLDKENLVSTTLNEVKESLEEGSMILKKLNIQTADGKSGIRIENGKVILKGDILFEDKEGKLLPIQDYIAASILRQLNQQGNKGPTPCSATSMLLNKSISLSRCTITNGECDLAVSSTLDCSCSIVLPKGVEGDLRRVSCQSSRTGSEDSMCYMRKGTCNNIDIHDNIHFTRVSCPRYSLDVKCHNGQWIKE